MLIRNIDTLRIFAALNGDWDFNLAKPSLRIVESKIIVPVLGKDLYTVVDELLNDADKTTDIPMPDFFEKLIEHCRMVIGPAFCAYHAEKADVLFTTSGMQRSESAQNKNAYQEQRSKFIEANLREADDAQELLYQFLEENRQAFPEWTDSPEFLKYRSLFIKTGEEFNAVFPSGTPYRNYRRLQPHLYDVEQRTIKPLLGKVIFAALKEKDWAVEPDFTEEEAVLLSDIKRAVANLAVAAAVPFLHVQIGPNGLTMPATASFSTNDGDNVRNGMSDKLLTTFTNSCAAAGADWMGRITQFITDNKTAFESWPGFAVPDEDATEESYTNAGESMLGF